MRAGRRTDVSVTSKGRALLRRSRASPQRDIVEALGRLPSRVRRRLAALLAELVRGMGIEHAPAPMMFEDDANASVARFRVRGRRRSPAGGAQGRDRLG